MGTQRGLHASRCQELDSLGNLGSRLRRRGGGALPNKIATTLEERNARCGSDDRERVRERMAEWEYWRRQFTCEARMTRWSTEAFMPGFDPLKNLRRSCRRSAHISVRPPLRCEAGCNSDTRCMPSSPPKACLQNDSYLGCCSAHSLRGRVMGHVLRNQSTRGLPCTVLLDPRDPSLRSERTQGFAAGPVYGRAKCFLCWAKSKPRGPKGASTR